eukprot:TRINITY_DN71987_c0_g1_i1.p1 TRINITY_DN71987_c0_g1~~TRINITY_DN71987_c0_g1_i1.p1  ORF type:complete len:412 (+),score=105.41 TRINITY_DN71987_c0_g1_i1:74-1237(+)
MPWRPQPLCDQVLEEAEEQGESHVSASGQAFHFTAAGLSVTAAGIQVAAASPAYAQRAQEGETRGVNSVDELDWAHAEQIGGGSSGKVFACIHSPTGMRLAVKQIHTDEDHARREILKELEALYCDRSRFIVEFHGAFWHEGCVLIALELMDASLLEAKQLLGRIPEEACQAVAWYVAQGLIYLHTERRKIHRDIKPSNLLINSEGHVKITDFGVSSGSLRPTLGLTSADTFVGTALYMSPERLSGQAHSYSSDVWSLGLVLIEMVRGAHPYSAVGQPDPNYWEMFQRVTQMDGPSIDPKRDNVSDDMVSFCDACAAKDPEDRASAVILMAHAWLLPLTDEVAAAAMRPVAELVDLRKKQRQRERDRKDNKSQSEAMLADMLAGLGS